MLIRENIPEGKKLHPKIKQRWFLERLVVIFPLFAALAVLLYLVGYIQGTISPSYLIVVLILVIFTLATVYSEIELKYGKFVYALREKDFLIQKGIVEKIRYVIPYEKIQNVTVSRDFVEVMLGLGTLHIETAAHVYLENDIVLPGISNDSNLVNEIVERSKIAKQTGQKAVDYQEPEHLLLRHIVEELREIKKLLQKQLDFEDKDHLVTHSTPETADISGQLKHTKVLYEKLSGKKRDD